ncbi:prepilin-type N-terminal cleavage/methylation domain-containing protein [Pseudoalteromonas shioyasakiensis]|uniref:prepilin-type N-terminal cleavage/methylation domain-containing protein n=1 Tax=Pseudoalteromonas shioyasakiensis TaxID=1190813 RepID=UPI002118F163|nr:prepilin-type N-terminal cleavage/methylation domain-containing protein [Pseudoalteromonas shioyasakiensis]MCQ8881336.1 prepilin-type N-terminal cleavage/methylation domain-containing protein [Pseudoalteromonas shioyasakiensis]
MVKLQSKQSGFTLIELLLATSVLMLVLYAGYFGYGLYTQKWQTRTNHFWQQSQQALAFDAITRVFESASTYIVESDKNEPAQYFSGDNERVIFISTSPLFSHEASVVEFKILQNDGAYSLVYNEASMRNNLLLKQSDVIEWEHQVTLLDNLKRVSFVYYGWTGLDEVSRNYKEDNVNSQTKPQLYAKHVMEDIRILPISLTLKIEGQNGEQSNFPVALPEEAFSVLIDYLRLEI